VDTSQTLEWGCWNGEFQEIFVGGCKRFWEKLDEELIFKLADDAGFCGTSEGSRDSGGLKIEPMKSRILRIL
jgi:hypothetical protein